MTTTTSRVIAVRPDGDLTIEGTNVWLPADIDQIEQERNEVTQRLVDLNAAARFVNERSLIRRTAHLFERDNFREG